jgi:TRAF3-interacting protein 1
LQETVKIDAKNDFSEAPAGVILEGENLKDEQDDKDEEDEEDDIGVKRDAFLDPGAVEDGRKHGKLVRDILKEQEKTMISNDFGEGTSTVSERVDGIKLGRIGGKERKNSYSQQMIEVVRENIQKICQSVNPLGKCIDFVEEDLELMRLELDKWKQEQKLQRQKLEKEQKSTVESLIPLQKELQRIDNQIEEARQQIRGLRGNILRNDDQLRMLLEKQTRSR